MGYTRLKRMTSSQRNHIRALLDYCEACRIVGVDIAGRPVVARIDTRGEVRYAIRADGSGTDPYEPVIDLDLDQDVAEIDRNFIEPLYIPD